MQFKKIFEFTQLDFNTLSLFLFLFLSPAKLGSGSSQNAYGVFVTLFSIYLRLSLEQVHHQSKPFGVMLLAPKSLVHCHQGSVLLNVKCSPATVVVAAIVRIDVAAVTCWTAATTIVVTAPTQNPAEGRVGLHGQVEHVTC